MATVHKTRCKVVENPQGKPSPPLLYPQRPMFWPPPHASWRTRPPSFVFFVCHAVCCVMQRPPALSKSVVDHHRHRDPARIFHTANAARLSARPPQRSAARPRQHRLPRIDESSNGLRSFGGQGAARWVRGLPRKEIRNEIEQPVRGAKLEERSSSAGLR